MNTLHVSTPFVQEIVSLCTQEGVMYTRVIGGKGLGVRGLCVCVCGGGADGGGGGGGW